MMTQEMKLERFINDIECLNPVLEYNSRLNIFRLLGVPKKEICHSNVIAWLLDPHGTHGLGSAVLKELIFSLSGFDNMAWDSFVIQREWHEMDILATSEEDKYLLCIENKTKSSEHSNQLNQYRTLAELYYPDYKRQYVYLTINGKQASEPENWKQMSYAELLQIIERVKLDGCNSEAAVIIKHYKDTLRRDIVGDDELKELCQQIYIKHKTALDLIIANKPSKAKVYETLMSWAKYKTNREEIQLDLDHSDKSCVRFTTQKMSRMMLITDTEDIKKPYFYEICIKESTHVFFIQISFRSANMSSRQYDILKRIMELCKNVQVMKKGMEFYNPFVAKHQDYYGLQSDDIWIAADKMYTDMKEFEKEIETALNAEYD